MSLDPLSSPYAVWLWLAAGAVLLSLEVVLPGVFLLWFGLAAVLVGLVLWAWPLAPLAQIGLFAALSVLLLVLARLVLRYGETVSDPGRMSMRGQRYVGHTYVLEESIANGRGKVRIGDTLWIAEGPDLPAGRTVRVKAAEGTVLQVEAA